MEFEEMTEKIIKCAITVHQSLGPGLLESAYKECLHYKLIQIGLKSEKEKGIPIIFEEIRLDCGYRIDLLVENEIVIEINFNVRLLREGIKWVVN